MAVRKIPIRKCIACGALKPKKELIRIVRTPDSEVFIDPKGKVSGRGAYLCPAKECFTLAHKKKAITRALEVEISPERFEQLTKDWDEIVK